MFEAGICAGDRAYSSRQLAYEQEVERSCGRPSVRACIGVVEFVDMIQASLVEIEVLVLN